MSRYLVCITGASGAIYARRLLRALAMPDLAGNYHELHLVASAWGERVMKEETGLTVQNLMDELDGGSARAAVVRHDCENLAASVASGSFRLDGTILCPCSMASVGAIASGAGRNLVHRAAAVALKEGWPLVVVPRESPLSLLDLRNLSSLAEAGAAIMPASPGFYHRPQDIDALVDGFISRVLDRIGAPNPLSRPWTGPGGDRQES